MNAERAERAALTSQPFLDALSRERRRELVNGATELLKEHGPEGLVSDPNLVVKMDRAEIRRRNHAMGYRGTKAKHHHVERQSIEIAKAVALDSALTVANARMQMGPIERAKLRIREGV